MSLSHKASWAWQRGLAPLVFERCLSPLAGRFALGKTGTGTCAALWSQSPFPRTPLGLWDRLRETAAPAPAKGERPMPRTRRLLALALALTTSPTANAQAPLPPEVVEEAEVDPLNQPGNDFEVGVQQFDIWVFGNQPGREPQRGRRRGRRRPHRTSTLRRAISSTRCWR